MDKLKKYNQYLKGELPEEQLELFIRDVVKDPMEAEILKEKWGSILEKDSDFQELKKEILAQEKPAREKKLYILSNRRQVLSLSAGLLFLISAVFFIFSQKEKGNATALASQELDKPFAYQDSRGNNVESHELRILASDQYRSGEFTAAAQSFEKLITTSQELNEDRFYLGLSSLYNGDYSKAITNLALLKDMPNFKMNKEAKWFLSLALIQAGLNDQAKIELRSMADMNGWKSKEAKQILGLLETNH